MLKILSLPPSYRIYVEGLTRKYNETPLCIIEVTVHQTYK